MEISVMITSHWVTIERQLSIDRDMSKIHAKARLTNTPKLISKFPSPALFKRFLLFASIAPLICYFR